MSYSELRLNREVYPLYVGGSAKEAFRDWVGKGSSVLLEARVVSRRYSEQDIRWSIDQEEIICFDERNPEETGKSGKRRVRARRTGIANITVSLPDRTSVRCMITVIDHISRMTVGEIVLNTSYLHMK